MSFSRDGYLLQSEHAFRILGRRCVFSIPTVFPQRYLREYRIFSDKNCTRVGLHQTKMADGDFDISRDGGEGISPPDFSQTAGFTRHILTRILSNADPTG